MRRSWVLADGERKRLTALKSSNKLLSIATGCSGNGQVSPAMSDSSSLLMMDKDESDQIQDCLDKMTMIRNQTEDMNPEVLILFFSLTGDFQLMIKVVVILNGVKYFFFIFPVMSNLQ